MCTSTSDSDLHQKLKSTLWFQIGKIVDEETLNLGIHATPQYIGSLTELVWTQIANTATDLESFAQHAGRNTVKTDDAMLLTRRNEGLEGILKEEVERLKRKKEEGRGKS
jgi:centromere protein S